MSIFNKINGVWRELWSSDININGVWRETNIDVDINGVWRPTHRHNITEQDIVGFKLVYYFIPNKTHPLHPHLVTNKKIPFTFDVTGEDMGMNTTTKGVMLHYERGGNAEGIVMYLGVLYALLNSGRNIVMISDTNPDVDDNDLFLEGIPEISNGRNMTTRMESLSIQIFGYSFVNGFGFLSGWNEFFDNVSLLTGDVYDRIDPRVILPSCYRLPTYRDIASIGVARNLTKADNNMLGSYGVIDHTIYSIKVNGTAKPFTIEIQK